jgi:hypothetical protein
VAHCLLLLLLLLLTVFLSKLKKEQFDCSYFCDSRYIYRGGLPATVVWVCKDESGSKILRIGIESDRQKVPKLQLFLLFP